MQGAQESKNQRSDIKTNTTTTDIKIIVVVLIIALTKLFV